MGKRKTREEMTLGVAWTGETFSVTGGDVGKIVDYGKQRMNIDTRPFDAFLRIL